MRERADRERRADADQHQQQAHEAARRARGSCARRSRAGAAGRARRPSARSAATNRRSRALRRDSGVRSTSSPNGLPRGSASRRQRRPASSRKLQLVPGRETEHDVVVRPARSARSDRSGSTHAADRRDLSGVPMAAGVTDRLQPGAGAGVRYLPDWVLHGHDADRRRTRPRRSCAQSRCRCSTSACLQLAVARHGVQRAPTTAKTAAYCDPSVPTPVARRWSIDDPMALDNGALDHPPSHKEGKYR